MTEAQQSSAQYLPATAPLTAQGDLAAQMVDGIDRYLMRELAASPGRRKAARKNNDVAARRERFTKIIGLVDERVQARMQIIAYSPNPVLARGAGYKVYAVRWPVLKGVQGEGLLLVPDKSPVADVVALPDCDWSPERLVGLAPGVPPESQFARRLVENGCRVLVPVLIDRKDTWSGILGHMTNLPHREFIWRAAYEMGRTMAGYEVQKVLAAVDWFTSDSRKDTNTQSTARKVGVVGYGEGGMLALYAAAADSRIDACCVSGYFGPREGMWAEPIYRNAFGLLSEFGDAELAAMIRPRGLVIEAVPYPNVTGPPPAEKGRTNNAAPGAIRTPALAEIQAEADRTGMLGAVFAPWPRPPNHYGALETFFLTLGGQDFLRSPGVAPRYARTASGIDADARMHRQFAQIVEHTQGLMRESPARRAEFWKNADSASPKRWAETTKPYREKMWDDLIGRLPAPTMPLNPRTRQVYDTPKFVGYEVMLDAYPDVFAYGILLVPKGIPAGERRAVVVCQHGLEGRPQDVADPAVDSHYYHQFACRLAEEGFVTYAPQNPYIGGDRFRVLLRKAQPLGLTLFSFIVRQHERTLDWLQSLPFVDPERIGFYGLSYGGKSAMRIPALLERYKLSICSADYNEWVWKCASADSPYSYLLTNEYDMPEWNLANTFNYAEMSWLICPRPFMVERGHEDTVAPDEWVSYEYARTRRMYDKLGIGDRTQLEIFNGPHTIHGVGTFAFLRKFLWKDGKP